MTVMDMITNMACDIDETDNLWYKFVVDHKALLLANAKSYNISLSLMSAMKYNVYKFFRYMNLNPSYAWIALYISDIHNDIEFANITTLMVPNKQYVDDLYTLYQTTIAAANQLS